MNETADSSVNPCTLTEPVHPPSTAAFALAAIGVAAATFLLYLPSRHNGFVLWDDTDALVDNPAFRGFAWANLRWMFTTFHMGHYQPLAWLTYAMDFALWGMNPTGYHLTSAVIHSLNGALFFVLASQLLNLAVAHRASEPRHLRTIAAAFAALVFSVHPLRVESVAWATERRDVVSGFFAILTLIAYLRAASATGRRSHRRWLAASLALFVAAVLSKSITITLLAVVCVLDVYPLRRLSADPRTWLHHPGRRIVAEKLLFLVPVVGGAIGAIIGQSHYPAIASWQQHDALSRIVQCLYGLAFYIHKTVWPGGLSAMYPLHAPLRITESRYLLAAAFVVAVSAAAVALRRRWPALAAVWLCYIAQLSPVLGVSQNGPQIAADRYSYLACLGWAVVAGAALLQFGRRRPAAGTAIACCILAALAWQTDRQIRVWRNSDTLWTHALSVDPTCHIAYSNMAQVCWERGEWAKSVDYSKSYLRLDSKADEVRLGMAVGLLKLDRPVEAAEHLAIVLKSKPNDASAHEWMGVAMVNTGRLDEGLRHLVRAVELDPTLAGPMNHLKNLAAQHPNDARVSAALEEATRHQRRKTFER